ncbi:MAG: magnesium transporter [Anaerotignum sp.]|nr:magnesium transporter [Anaerotignum sp.]
MIEVFTYEEMKKVAKERELPAGILEDMRKFGYGRYDSFDGFDCISVEILDFENLLLSKGSVLFYLEKEKKLCFTSRRERIEELFFKLQDKVGQERMIYEFFEELTKGDDVAFDMIEKETMELEQALIASGKRDCVSEIISLRKRLMVLKKYYEQFLNVLDILIQNENEIFDGKSIKSFKMLYRRTERRFQNVLNLRESVTQVRESYEAEVDISLNTTMKIFTVVTTIFLPLTLIVGWYGMNFDMPEYDWKHGYFFVTLISAVFILAGVLFFRKKKWF